jgi:hypothetical protein
MLLKEKSMAKPRYIFQAGDRVIERGKNGAIPNVKEESKAIVEQNRQLRRGVVVGFTTKVNARKQTTNYVQVLWDKFKTPSEHASMRLSLLPNE